MYYIICIPVDSISFTFSISIPCVAGVLFSGSTGNHNMQVEGIISPLLSSLYRSACSAPPAESGCLRPDSVFRHVSGTVQGRRAGRNSAVLRPDELF